MSRGRLWAGAAELAGRLPGRPYQLNLCENRYVFCLCLLAAAMRGQTCLLPPSGRAGAVLEILRDYPGAYLACEHDPQLPGAEWFEAVAPGPAAFRPSEVLESKACLGQIDSRPRQASDSNQGCAGRLETMPPASGPPILDWGRATLIAFTSGSTGRPKPCAHTLAAFKTSADMAVRSLGLEGRRWLMVSTTPPQHMYGLETSVFWPLFSDLLLHDGRPFHPQDVRLAVETAPWPAVLVTTPAHLRFLVQAGGPWRNLAGVLSATDALPETLARAAETVLGLAPHEIYGSTETLSFARREPLAETLWRPYKNARLIQEADGQARLESPHLPGPLLLQDRFRIEADGGFAVLGRDADMVKIGGKRASLSELNRRLKDVEGVEDGFCYRQAEGRVAAVVVGRLDRQSIREALRPYVDEVFLPRKIHFVPRLPRDEVGKLAQAEVEALLAGLGEGSGAGLRTDNPNFKDPQCAAFTGNLPKKLMM